MTIFHKLQKNIQTSLNGSEVTLVVMADHSKGFDNVNYSTLIKTAKVVKVKHVDSEL